MQERTFNANSGNSKTKHEKPHSLGFYTDASPNGYKISIALEELELPYDLNHIRIDEYQHREQAFLELNPFGRIPVLVDKSEDIVLFESAAILLYLAEMTGRLLPDLKKDRWEAIKWLTFHSASMGPILGQRVHFEIFDGAKNLPAIQRYRSLSEKLFGTLDQHLAEHEWLAGHQYSIADIATFGWTHIAQISNISFARFEHLSRWHNQVAMRPGVQRGIEIPMPATGP